MLFRSLGFAAAALSLLASLGAPSLVLPFEMLEDQALFRVPRAALLLSGLLVGRSVVSTVDLPQIRKPEVLFLVTLLAFLCDLLILSRHAGLSVILLVMCSWVGIFLSGLAYRGRREGEAVLKFWMQASISLALGFGSILLLTLIAGGAHFSVIGEYVRSQAAFSPQNLMVVGGLFLPFFMAGGFFPFHFVCVDRDHGVPWAMQTLLSVTFQGAVAVAAWQARVTAAMASGSRAARAAGRIP